MHDLEFAPNLEQILQETLPALQDLKTRGIIRKIGITSYSLQALHAILEGSPVRIDSVLTYSRLALHDRSLMEDMPWLEPGQGESQGLSFAAYVARYGARLVNAAPLGMGLLTQVGPPNWHPVWQTPLAATARMAAEVCAEWGVDVAQLALYYAIMMAAGVRGAGREKTQSSIARAINTTMVSCVTVEQMRSNLRIATLISEFYNIKNIKPQKWIGTEKEDPAALFQKYEHVLEVLLPSVRDYLHVKASDPVKLFFHSRHWEGVELATSLGSAPVPWDDRQQHAVGRGHIYGNFHEYYHFHRVQAR